MKSETLVVIRHNMKKWIAILLFFSNILALHPCITSYQRFLFENDLVLNVLLRKRYLLLMRL
jgi:hypothetical protein